VVTILNETYESDFLGFSYGFRPGRSQHQALDALAVGITRKRVNWVVDLERGNPAFAMQISCFAATKGKGVIGPPGLLIEEQDSVFSVPVWCLRFSNEPGIQAD
jgi:hypothetical protein